MTTTNTLDVRDFETHDGTYFRFGICPLCGTDGCWGGGFPSAASDAWGDTPATEEAHRPTLRCEGCGRELLRSGGRTLCYWCLAERYPHLTVTRQQALAELCAEAAPEWHTSPVSEDFTPYLKRWLAQRRRA
jgi:hypothetical protein